MAMKIGYEKTRELEIWYNGGQAPKVNISKIENNGSNYSYARRFLWLFHLPIKPEQAKSLATSGKKIRITERRQFTAYGTVSNSNDTSEPNGPRKYAWEYKTRAFVEGAQEWAAFSKGELGRAAEKTQTQCSDLEQLTSAFNKIESHGQKQWLLKIQGQKNAASPFQAAKALQNGGTVDVLEAEVSRKVYTYSVYVYTAHERMDEGNISSQEDLEKFLESHQI